ncbi:MAG: ROK family transcriptional regulator [Silicimonas sp.]|nr:ROK family transcriptional regulator [Silicimonas sp.]
MSLGDVEIIDPEGGANQSGLRDQNARLVLSYIRRHGAMPSAEIARRSGLSAQTVSNITRALEADGLLLRREAIKGKVGKPSVPVALNPRGVHALGLSIGRRSAELVLIDFLGTQLETVSTTYPYPTIEDVFAFLRRGMDQIFAKHPRVRASVTGIGVARPSKLWQWLEVVHAPEEAMRKWQDLNIIAAISERTGFEAFAENDATSACVAEHLLGHGDTYSDFAYIFMGAFIGGGLVLNGKVFSGRTGNAASFGPMPVSDGKGGTTELLNVASLHVLESMLSKAGIDPMRLRQNPDDWSFCEPHLSAWIAQTSQSLAIASAAIVTVVEVEAILIDGAMPKEVTERLTQLTSEAFENLELTLIERPLIAQARVGKNARSLGAALLPIHSRYFLA